MRRILFIGMTSNPGGLETLMVNIFKKLNGKHFHFDFLNISDSNIAYSSFIIRNGGNIKQILLKETMPNYFVKHNYFIRHKFVHKLFNQFARHRIAYKFFKYNHHYDVVHLNTMSINSLSWLKVARKFNIKKLIIDSHTNGNEDSSVNKFSISYLLFNLHFLYNKLYLRCHPSIMKLAATPDSGKWMFGKNSNFKVVNIGIDPNNFKYESKLEIEWKKKLNIPSNDKVIIVVARIVKQKNYPKIINVFKTIYKRHNDFKLIIVGTGSEVNKVKNMVIHYHITNSVYFLGVMKRKEISKLLSIGDLMLMPSFFEAVPSSLLEAQSCGIPGLVSNNVPKESNVTGEVKRLSLNDSNYRWASVALALINKEYKNKYNFKLMMNKRISQSKYNLNHSINEIKNIYLNKK